MAQIGTFARTANGYSGRLRTLNLDVELTLVPAENTDSENAPDYRIHLGDGDEGPEVGAGWKRNGERARQRECAECPGGDTRAGLIEYQRYVQPEREGCLLRPR